MAKKITTPKYIPKCDDEELSLEGDSRVVYKKGVCFTQFFGKKKYLQICQNNTFREVHPKCLSYLNTSIVHSGILVSVKGINHMFLKVASCGGKGSKKGIPTHPTSSSSHIVDLVPSNQTALYSTTITPYTKRSSVGMPLSPNHFIYKWNIQKSTKIGQTHCICPECCHKKEKDRCRSKALHKAYLRVNRTINPLLSKGNICRPKSGSNKPKGKCGGLPHGVKRPTYHEVPCQRYPKGKPKPHSKTTAQVPTSSSKWCNILSSYKHSSSSSKTSVQHPVYIPKTMEAHQQKDHKVSKIKSKLIDYKTTHSSIHQAISPKPTQSTNSLYSANILPSYVPAKMAINYARIGTRGKWPYLGGLKGGSPLPDNFSRCQKSQDKKEVVPILKTSGDFPMFGDHGAPITCLTINRNNIFTGGRDGVVQMWQENNNNVSTGHHQASINCHSRSINSMSSDPSQPRLITSSENCEVKLFDIQCGITLSSLPIQLSTPATCVGISSSGQMVTLSAGTYIYTWDIRSNQVISNNVYSAVTTACLTENGLVAAGDTDGLVMTWDPRTIDVIEFGFHDTTITHLHSQGGLLVSSEEGETVRLWDLTATRHLKSWAQESTVHRVLI